MASGLQIPKSSFAITNGEQRTSRIAGFWEEGYHGEAIYSEAFFLSKLEYIHKNPVHAGFVESPEHFVNSSAADYSGLRKGRLAIFVFSSLLRIANPPIARSSLQMANSEHLEERAGEDCLIRLLPVVVHNKSYSSYY
ncbi:hypothetical protein [Phnomibacter ginsenosidimutans]|uniref:Transposase n=1 Tax=Phnomibacter ginsenosidimutans TaxID=2676868 RepID=A0A6I6G7X2_9BACT|nr:hypothetical protein [Phnomibacter ginsenosidimutans]QGW28314.1 hypothetical protein GLV81_09580 [Phnomibacter ginsenosidimutans]